MQNADNDKAKALAIFTKNQDKILTECEQVMQRVESGEVRPKNVRSELATALNL